MEEHAGNAIYEPPLSGGARRAQMAEAKPTP